MAGSGGRVRVGIIVHTLLSTAVWQNSVRDAVPSGRMMCRARAGTVNIAVTSPCCFFVALNNFIAACPLMFFRDSKEAVRSSTPWSNVSQEREPSASHSRSMFLCKVTMQVTNYHIF